MDEIIVNSMEKWRIETNIVLKRICNALNNYKTPRDIIYKALEERGKCKLEQRLDILKVKGLQQGVSRSRVKSFNYLDVIANDPKLKEIYVSLIKEMALKHKVKM